VSQVCHTGYHVGSLSLRLQNHIFRVGFIASIDAGKIATAGRDMSCRALQL
jgi:hypothetical protein